MLKELSLELQLRQDIWHDVYNPVLLTNFISFQGSSCWNEIQV